MAIVRTRIVVEADGKVTLVEPLPAGEYLADLQPVQQPAQGPIDWSTFPTIDLGPWPKDTIFDRAEIYGDDRS